MPEVVGLKILIFSDFPNLILVWQHEHFNCFQNLNLYQKPLAEFKEFERGLNLSRGLNMVGST